MVSVAVLYKHKPTAMGIYLGVLATIVSAAGITVMELLYDTISEDTRNIVSGINLIGCNIAIFIGLTHYVKTK